jgi:hypothetical protein
VLDIKIKYLDANYLLRNSHKILDFNFVTNITNTDLPFDYLDFVSTFGKGYFPEPLALDIYNLFNAEDLLSSLHSWYILNYITIKHYKDNINDILPTEIKTKNLLPIGKSIVGECLFIISPTVVFSRILDIKTLTFAHDKNITKNTNLSYDTLPVILINRTFDYFVCPEGFYQFIDKMLKNKMPNPFVFHDFKHSDRYIQKEGEEISRDELKLRFDSIKKKLID